MIKEINKETGEIGGLVAGGTLYTDAPIGTVFPFFGTVAPDGFILGDATVHNKTDYLELWEVIPDVFKNTTNNTFVIDLREATLKGTGLTSKSNNHYDADGLALGEFIDDRVQAPNNAASVAPTYSWAVSAGGSSGFMGRGNIRYGATTEVKSVGVNWIIKAKNVGVPADFIEGVKNTLCSYSTEEKVIGTWIDGKPIYRKAYYNATNWANNAVVDTLANVKDVVKLISISRTASNEVYQNYSDGSSRNDATFNFSNGNLVARRSASLVSTYPASIVIEYTKTTD